jgi:integrase
MVTQAAAPHPGRSADVSHCGRSLGVAMKVTEGLIDRIKVPEGRRDVIVFDQQLNGFFLRVFATGRAAYGVDYYVNGKRRRMSLGPATKGALGAARRRATEILAKARLGADALQERDDIRERGKLKFETLAEKFLGEQKTRIAPRTYLEWERHLTKHLSPLNSSAIDKIERRDLVEQIDRIAGQAGAVTADHCRATLSVFFAWCVERDYREINPVIGISRRANNESRSRVLDDVELAEVWKHAGEGNHGLIVRLLALTGQRRTEIGSLRWSEFNEEKKLLIFPSERVKNRREHLLPLSAAAMEILATAPRWEEQAFVFGESGRSGYSGWSKSKARLDHRIKTARAKQGREPMPEWTLHDLRRTTASGMARLGVSLPVIERALNHVSGSFGGIVGIYQRHTFEKEVREALELWGKHVLSVCEASAGSSAAEQARDQDPSPESQSAATTA